MVSHYLCSPRIVLVFNSCYGIKGLSLNFQWYQSDVSMRIFCCMPNANSVSQLMYYMVTGIMLVVSVEKELLFLVCAFHISTMGSEFAFFICSLVWESLTLQNASWLLCVIELCFCWLNVVISQYYLIRQCIIKVRIVTRNLAFLIMYFLSRTKYVFGTVR